jgi:FKBP-type peptidyl-prolyl cis-trans isomerase FkpA
LNQALNPFHPVPGARIVIEMMNATSRRRPTVLAVIAAAAILGAMAGCGDSGPDQSTLPAEHRVAERYASALNVELADMERRPTGLYVQDVVVGEGARADSGDIVVVHYTGWLPQGKEFDSSVGGDPLEVAIGYGRVIQGWDQGVVGMHVGGQRRLVIPPALGYGEGGTGPIPGNSTLVFDVELLDVEDRTP